MTQAWSRGLRRFGTVFMAYSTPDARSAQRRTLQKEPTPRTSPLANWAADSNAAGADI